MSSSNHSKSINTLWCDGHVSAEKVLNRALPYAGTFANGYSTQSESDASVWDRN